MNLNFDTWDTLGTETQDTGAKAPVNETSAEDETVTRMKRQRERARAAWMEYTHLDGSPNVLKKWIEEGIITGEPLIDTLLKALECIALVTGDSDFYTLNRDRLQPYVIKKAPAEFYEKCIIQTHAEIERNERALKNPELYATQSFSPSDLERNIERDKKALADFMGRLKMAEIES